MISLSGRLFFNDSSCLVDVLVTYQTRQSKSQDLNVHFCHICPNNLSLKKALHSALPPGLLVDATHAYILIDCEEGNHVSALGVGGNVLLVTVDLVDSQNQLSVPSP